MIHLRRLILAALVLLPVRSALRAAGFAQDEGALLTYPWRFLAHAIPHRDFVMRNGPGEVWLLAPIYRVLGTSLVVERLVGLATSIAFFTALAILLAEASAWRRFMSLAFAIVIMSPMLIASTFISALTAGLGALAAAKHGRPALAGFLAGAALAFRFDVAPAVALGLFFVTPRLDWRRVAAGAAAPVAALGLHFVIAGPTSVFEGVILDSLRQSGGRSLPLPTSGKELVLLVTLGVACAYVAFVAVRDPKARATAAFGLLLVPQALQRADFYHLAQVTVVVLPFAVAALPAWREEAIALAIGALILVTGARLWVEPTLRSVGVRDDPSHAVAHHGRRWIVGDAATAEALRAILNEVDGLCARRLFVGPRDLRFATYNDSYLYWLADVKPAGRHIELNPGVSNRTGSGWDRDLASADVAVLNATYFPNEPNSSRDPGPNLEPVLRRHFTPRNTHGPWTLFATAEAGCK